MASIRDPPLNQRADGIRERLTRLRAHLVQQLHHALPLHGGPVLDGRAPSDLAVLLLDLWRAALGDERPERTAGWKHSED